MLYFGKSVFFHDNGRINLYDQPLFQKEELVDKAKDLSEEDSEAHVAKLIRFVVVVHRRRNLSDG
jgi:hypothetical protein